MNDIVRTALGGVIGGIVMFVVGFVFWASPLQKIAYASASESQGAAVQLALSVNLPHTGRYIVPDPNTAGGTVLYGRGPIATIDYQTQGFSTSDPASMVGGFVQEVVVALMIAFTLYAVAWRVPDFETQARLVIGFSAAACVLLALSDPIWAHSGWTFAIYGLIADAAMLIVPGLVIARWFLPRPKV